MLRVRGKTSIKQPGVIRPIQIMLVFLRRQPSKNPLLYNKNNNNSKYYGTHHPNPSGSSGLTSKSPPVALTSKHHVWSWWERCGENNVGAMLYCPDFYSASIPGSVASVPPGVLTLNLKADCGQRLSSPALWVAQRMSYLAVWDGLTLYALMSESNCWNNGLFHQTSRVFYTMSCKLINESCYSLGYPISFWVHKYRNPIIFLGFFYFLTLTIPYT